MNPSHNLSDTLTALLFLLVLALCLFLLDTRQLQLTPDPQPTHPSEAKP